MAENLSWLFGAFTIGGAVIIGYLIWMSNKERALRRRVGVLEDVLKRDDGFQTNR
jgi:hypothetical protein